MQLNAYISFVLQQCITNGFVYTIKKDANRVMGQFIIKNILIKIVKQHGGVKTVLARCEWLIKQINSFVQDDAGLFHSLLVTFWHVR